MPAPKGHSAYTGCEKGGQFGYLGKPQDAYTQDEVMCLGKEMLEWFAENPQKIWLKDFFIYRGINANHVNYLKEKYSSFRELYDLAKEMQEGRLNEQPFWKKADGAQARFMLARHHEGYRDSDLEESMISSKSASDLISNLIKKKDKE